MKKLILSLSDVPTTGRTTLCELVHAEWRRKGVAHSRYHTSTEHPQGPGRSRFIDLTHGLNCDDVIGWLDLSSLVLLDVATGDTPGGGPIESLIRMPLQTGAMVELDLGNKVLETVIKGADQGIMYTLVSVFQAIPRFGQFNTADFVAYGFNISGGLVARHLTMTLAYFLLTSLIAYFFLSAPSGKSISFHSSFQ